MHQYTRIKSCANKPNKKVICSIFSGLSVQFLHQAEQWESLSEMNLSEKFCEAFYNRQISHPAHYGNYSPS